jgi:hypothetical protein
MFKEKTKTNTRPKRATVKKTITEDEYVISEEERLDSLAHMHGAAEHSATMSPSSHSTEKLVQEVLFSKLLFSATP